MTKERENPRTREQILKDSDLLQVFTDPFIETDNVMWLKMFNKVLTEKRDEALQVLNLSMVDRDINSLYEKIKIPIFFPDIDVDTQAAYLLVLALVGYEIGNNQEAEIFVSDLTKPLLFLNVMYDTPTTIDTVRKATQCGVRWKRQLGKELPNVIVKAIDNLDLKGL